MLYTKHDFVSNLNSYVASGENKKAQKVIVDEIGRTLVYHRGHVISALNEAGIKTAPNASDKDVTNKIAQNLGTNKKLTASLSVLMTGMNNGSSFYHATGCKEGQIAHFMNAEGDQESAFAKFLGSLKGGGGASGGGGSASPTTPQGKVGADPVSAIAGAIGSIFSFAGAKTQQKTEEKTAKAQADAQRLALAQQILASKNGQQPSATTMGGTTKIVLISVGVIVVGVVAYFALRTKK